jgi:hypothetical protein
MTSMAQLSQPSRTSQHPPMVMPNSGSTDGSHDVVDSNKDTNGMTTGLHGDIYVAAGTILPLKDQPGVQWSSGHHMQHNH